MIQFLNFELNFQSREILRSGELVALPPKVFDVLCYLIENRDRMVPKSELMDQFWSVNASEAALQKVISQIRKALETNDSDQKLIRTYHGQGLRFIPPITEAKTGGAQTERFDLALEEQYLVAFLCVRIGVKSTSGGDATGAEGASLAYFKDASRILKSYQGGLLRTLSDGFIAVFGLDPGYEDSARRAVHCSSELVNLAKSDRYGFHISCGIDSGSASSVTDKTLKGQSTAGSLETEATRLAHAGANEEVLLSAATAQRVSSEVETKETEHGFLLSKVKRKRAGIPARVGQRQTVFVGRAVEMAFLQAHKDRMCENRMGLGVILEGAAGIGKTRLVTEFLSSLDKERLNVLKIQCLPGLRNSPRAAIRELCDTLFASDCLSNPQDDLEKALFDDLLEQENPNSFLLKGLSEFQLRQKSRSLLVRLIREKCRQVPLVLLLEDVHWLDATSREYVESIQDSIEGLNLFLVLTTRPDVGWQFTGSLLKLSPLSLSDSRVLVNDICGENGPSEEEVNELVQRAAGNPFFVEELTLATQDDSESTFSLPESVQAVVSARISALEVDLRTLLHLIAIIGPPAPFHLIAFLLKQERELIEQRMGLLVQMGFVQLEPDGCSFRHMLINDTAYVMVTLEERSRQHALIAGYFEARKEQEDVRPELLAWHHQQAGHIAQAVSYWILASRKALYRSARQEVLTFAEQGLSLIESLSERFEEKEAELQILRATALIALKGYGAQEVREAYRRAQVLNESFGNLKSEVRILVGLWIHSWVRGQLTLSLEYAGKLLSIADETGDPALIQQANASAGEVLLHKGELEQAKTYLDKGLTSIEEFPPKTMPGQNAATSCVAYAAWAASLMGKREEAEQHIKSSRALSAMAPNPFAEAIHFALCSEPYMFLGDVERCLAYADQAVTVSREHGFAFWLGTGLVMRGWAMSQLGEIGHAFEAVNEGIEVFEGTGAGVQLCNWYGLKAEILLAAGEIEAALMTGEHALICAETAEDPFFTPRVHATCSMLCKRLGRVAEARQHHEHATNLIEKFSMSKMLIEA